MRKAVVSLAAVLMVLASMSPAFAAPPSSASNDTFAISVSGPSVVTAGQTVRFTGTITMNADGTSGRKPVVYALALLSEDGPISRIPLRSGVRNMAPGHSKTATRALTINERARPGQYVIAFEVTVDGQQLIVGLPLEIKGK